MLRAGDFVTIRGNALTWEIVSVRDGASPETSLAWLKSGNSGRRRSEPLSSLTLFKVGDLD